MAPRKTIRAKDTRLGFEGLSIEGNLVSPAWLARVAQLSAPSQGDADYRIPKGLNLRDEIGRYWRMAQAHWAEFKTGFSSGSKAPRLSETFVGQLLRDCFGFASFGPAQPVTQSERSFPIGYSAISGHVPIVVAPAASGLDKPLPEFGDDGRRRSAFGLAQEYLNAADDSTWGIATDGCNLRILRDNSSLTRPAWIEADLQRIFQEELYPDFVALWLILHESRFGSSSEPSTTCILEQWRASGQNEGTRAREHLRRGVEEAILALGNGFLSHPNNQQLRASLQSGSLTTIALFGELLRLVYRLIFLLTVEERNLLHPPGASQDACKLYAEGYSMRRLREQSVRRNAHDRYSDLWEAAKIVLATLSRGEPRLGLPALGGLFAASQCPTLDSSRIENRFLLQAVFKLSWLREDSSLSRVNWRDMGPEEFGSVYESLLELVPQISNGNQFRFVSSEEAAGNARKTSGSYYTPDSLVQLLLDSALEPVVADAVKGKAGNDRANAILALRVCDPACGSGHFLLGAAHRLAKHLATTRAAAGQESSLGHYRQALREVVRSCLYGVDLNPMAIELCRISLWLESMEPGTPLAFLKAHIKPGNSLLGATPELLKKGIPDEAFQPLTGDNKAVVSYYKKRNKAERKQLSIGQRNLIDQLPATDGAVPATVPQLLNRIVAEPEDSLEAVRQHEEAYEQAMQGAAMAHAKLVADAWCAAFVWKKDDTDGPGIVAGCLGKWNAITEKVFRNLQRDPAAVPEKMRDEIGRLADQYKFFHWYLEFPEVFGWGDAPPVAGHASQLIGRP